MHKFSLAFKQGTLEEVELRQRVVWRADKKINRNHVTIMILSTPNPEIFAVCHLHEYEREKQLIESLGFNLALRVDIVLRRALTSV